VSDHARAAGKTGLQCRAWEHRPEGIAFLVNRGFRELERARMVSLDLAGLPLPVIAPPPGIGLTTLADRPDLVAGVHAVALEAFDDIPGGDTPMAAGDLAEFRARDVDRPGIPADAFMIAVDQASDEAVGYASLMFRPGSTTVAWHDMTAVRRTWRGRGIATALKLATIDWAIRNGLSALETGNDEDNAGMRAVNARLGYRPLPDELTMRGPLLTPAAWSA
jgi:mycothiol synthase